ncbi:hypothetical protein AB6A40_004568 [Gnathostoma spinigerum]|uniref:Uncharacterized protein n=1 Tax=Gnathostoma spinigerum TaxID=75299 RepID=A0ABD6EI76_9BILA
MDLYSGILDDDFDSLCLFEEVESESERCRLMQGLAVAELTQAQMTDFFRAIGTKICSYDPEKVVAGCCLVTALTQNIRVRRMLTMYARIIVRLILDWIPKVCMQNWNASMNRRLCDALYQISWYASSMRETSAKFIMDECRRMLFSQMLTVSGQTLVLDIILRFGVPFIYDFDVVELLLLFENGSEFSFIKNATNALAPVSTYSEPEIRHVYLDFYNSWQNFLFVYCYRVVKRIEEQAIIASFSGTESMKSKECDYEGETNMDPKDHCLFSAQHIDVRCSAGKSLYADLAFVFTVSFSEIFSAIPHPEIPSGLSCDPTSSQHAHHCRRRSLLKTHENVRSKMVRRFNSQQLDHIVRSLSRGITVDLSAFYEEDTVNSEHSFPQINNGSSNNTLKEDIESRKAQARAWTDAQFSLEERTNDGMVNVSPTLAEVFDIEINFIRALPQIAVHLDDYRKVSNRSWTEILKIYGYRTQKWRPRSPVVSDSYNFSLGSLSHCLI